MPRQFISEQRLLSKINAKFASKDECRDYTVSSLIRVEEDRTGRNWSIAAISGSVSSIGTGSSQADKIIDTFKNLYNFPE